MRDTPTEGTLINAIKVPILIVPEEFKPHFFIKWDSNDKRYRISASFKYLNTNYGLHINIIRNFEEFENSESADTLKFLLSLIKNHEKIEITSDLKYWHYIDTDNNTELFLVERDYNDSNSFLIVFFSLTFWSFTDYMEEV